MKRLPSLTKSQRRALLIIEWVLLIGIIGYSVRSWKRYEVPTKEMAETKDTQSNHPAKQYTYAVEEEPFETFPFDPNTADSTTLLRLGLPLAGAEHLPLSCQAWSIPQARGLQTCAWHDK